MRGPPLGGLEALPLPGGEPTGLWSAAAVLRAAAARIGSPPPAGGVGILGRWSGEAAGAAVDELSLVAALESSAAHRLARAAAVLGAYADTLDAAQRTVATLQASWDAALPADPLAGLPESTLSRVAALHGVAAAELRIAADVAAHRLRALVSEVVDVGRPGHRGPPVLGWSDPPPSDAAVRAAVLAGLPVTSGAAARGAAAGLADAVVRDLTAVAVGDLGSVGGALTRIGTGGRDPLVAQALWSRLDPHVAGRALDALARAGDEAGFTGLVDALGSALAVAANPRYAAGLDPASRAELDAWREPWLAGLAASVVAGGVAAAAVQAALLTGVQRVGLSPGSRYAGSVGAAVVAADRALRSGSGSRPAAALTGGPGPAGDPVLAVARAVEGDAEAARAWLLAPVPGSGRQLVVDHLVAGRYLTLDPATAAASFAATAGLVVTAGADPANRNAVALDAALLQAVGAEARDTGRPDAYRAAIGSGLTDVAAVIARHPDALTAVLDDSSGLGVDGRLASASDRLTRPGQETGTWEAVLADRATAAALLGAVALDQPSPGGRAPAVALVLGSLGERLDDDLVAAVRADHAGDPHALDAVSRRLGQAVGFTLTSAGEGLARRDADTDARNRMLARLLEAGVDKVAVPGAAGRAATPLVRAAADRLVAANLPTDAEAAQRAATRRTLDAASEAAVVEVRALVSRAQPWTAEQSPQRWATEHGAVRFWDDAGAPLSESAMTTEQRRAFTTWRRDVGVSVYDTAPAVVQDGIDAGIRAATRSVG
ncbi:MAG TPA: hypothetical protein VFT68_03800 [Lapillicoccus sp.]|nr:hypothetical protein [Lapillicoccus sp.]